MSELIGEGEIEKDRRGSKKVALLDPYRSGREIGGKLGRWDG